MKRSAVIYAQSDDGRRCVALDAEHEEALLAYITQDARHFKKFTTIVNLLLDNLRNTNLYDKEDINERCKHVTAMKLFKGQENDRIYCQELRQDATGGKVFVVVAARLHEKKKNQRNKQPEINMIEAVASYEYDYTTFRRPNDHAPVQ